MTLPLRVDRDRARRHEVAALILAGLATDEGLHDLRRAAGSADDTAATRRLHAGLVAATGYRGAAAAPKSSLAAALQQSAWLLREGLCFEVHERLEDEWRTLTGARRAALQGLIQVVVALHHFAHDNRRGAVTLLAKGRARLARDGHTLAEVDVRAFLAGLEPWGRALEDGRWPDTLPMPALLVDDSVSSARAPRPSE